MIVVIPSARQVELDYLAPLIDAGARFIVVDDSEGRVRVDHPRFEVLDWGDRKKRLGARDDWFPRRNGACRDFGFYVAWCESDDDEVIVALDDDCDVTDPRFPEKVEEALGGAPRFAPSGAGLHWNILDQYEDVGPDLFPRGFPYSARAGYAPPPLEPAPSTTSEFNLGLWAGAFDVNAVDKLDGPKWEHPDARLRAGSVCVPPGTLVSVCSMNMQFRRRLVPAAYQFPMHVETLPRWKIDRYGDIWGGFALKLLMDRRGDVMSCGSPTILHRKAGDLQRNLVQEHLAHLVNDEMIELLRSAAAEVAPSGYLEMMRGFGDELDRRRERSSALLRPYLAHLVPSLRAWTDALAEG